jgi:hypothetical protein
MSRIVSFSQRVEGISLYLNESPAFWLNKVTRMNNLTVFYRQHEPFDHTIATGFDMIRQFSISRLLFAGLRDFNIHIPEIDRLRITHGK